MAAKYSQSGIQKPHQAIVHGYHSARRPFPVDGKLTHAVGFAVLLAAGAARIRISVFVFYNLLGTLPKSCLLVVIGYFFGRFYLDLSAQYRTISLVALVFGMLMTVYLMHQLWASHHRRDGLE